ncbi:MAG: endo alpha-1,4 polygalactosaminidase [Actinobacteria bacterium]|nr:endo alpha-1,4 polygalactosaminidase [Actinomycetota bacterium]
MLDHPLNVHNAADMGGPGTTLYDIDGIINSASTIRSLHSLNDKVICYIEVGAAGNYYSAADEGIAVTYFAQLKAAGDLGRRVSGFPEYYLNINSDSTLRIIEAMIRQQCAIKGFDAVEPDIDDSYTDETGFRISEAQNIRFDRVLGAYAHSLGLAWGQKNGDNDRQFSAALVSTADFLLDEECNFYTTCGIVTQPYVSARKLVLNAEYTDDWGSNVSRDLGRFCAFDASHHIDGTLFTSSLAGPRHACR